MKLTCYITKNVASSYTCLNQDKQAKVACLDDGESKFGKGNS